MNCLSSFSIIVKNHNKILYGFSFRIKREVFYLSSLEWIFQYEKSNRKERVAVQNEFRPLADDLSTSLLDRYQLGAVAAAFSEIIPIIWPVYDKTRLFYCSSRSSAESSPLDSQLDLATSHKRDARLSPWN